MLSESRKRANDKYIKSNYTQVGIKWPNDFVEDLREAVEASGESMASYIQKAILDRMAADGYELKRYNPDRRKEA